MTTNVQLCLVFKQCCEYKHRWFEKANKQKRQQKHNAAFQENKWSMGYYWKQSKKLKKKNKQKKQNKTKQIKVKVS